MKKILVGLAAAAAIAAPLSIAGAASAASPVVPTGNPTSEFALVAWQLPDGSWPNTAGQDIYPQTLAAEQFLTYDEVIPDVMGSVHSLDATLNALPGCHTYQVDLYFNNGDNAALVEQVLADGVLNAFEDTSLNLVVHNANQMLTVNNCQVAQFGGLTMGYYKNHTVSDDTWNAVRTANKSLFGSYTTSWTGKNGGLSILSASGSTNNGLDMLRAQFLATALRVQGLGAYGTQQFVVPGTSAVDPNATETVNAFLAHVNSTTLTTKAQITSVQTVLNTINQDALSSLFL